MTGVNSMIVNCYTYNTSFHLGTCAIFREARISQSPKDKVNMPIIQKLKCDTVYTISYSHLSATLA